MAAALGEVLEEVERILEPERFSDYCLNGLQVPGGDALSTLASGVTAHLELFERAREVGAQLLIVHHGLFWGDGVLRIDEQLKPRLQTLFDADIALAAYHLPLDAHPELGNNALLARALEGDALEPFALHRGQSIGYVARLPEPGVEPTRLCEQIHALTRREPLLFEFGPERVLRLAVVSGAGADYIDEALAAGADALLTGEAPERAMAHAHEAGIHLFLAGHYATETFGVRQLGEHLAQRFGLRHEFIDVPNPL